MKFDRTYLENINCIITQNDCFLKKIKKINKSRTTTGFTYQCYNQLCVCIIRIRETSQYLEAFRFRKENVYGQAFDFYEFINCVSIIEGCVESLFKVFDCSLSSFYTTKKVFKISNRTNQNDLVFFKFIRSASSMHPSETTKHNKITGHKFEVYPYALWTSTAIDALLSDKPEKWDIELISWNCKTDSNYKRYYLYIEEFFDFVKELLDVLKELIPIVQEMIDSYKEKTRCKRLKKLSDFGTYSEYLLYLRKRLESKNTELEFSDGGLLLASHIMSNIIISNEFKSYIKSRVEVIVNKMMTDIESLNCDEIFEELSLHDIIGNLEHGHYTSEKFHDYLYKEAICEIENNKFINFKDVIRHTENNDSYSDAEWAMRNLLKFKDCIFKENELSDAETYADLYEVTLQAIYKFTVLNTLK